MCTRILQVMHKAPLVEAKQIEHVANERAILGEVSHPFLVGLVGAFQDASSLYLLQVSERPTQAALLGRHRTVQQDACVELHASFSDMPVLAAVQRTHSWCV